MKPATPKQSLFAHEYVKDLNATQAAIRAGYAAGSADVEGSRLLGNASVKALIDKLIQARSQRLERDADWVLDRLETTYSQALAGKNYGAAVRALELIGKHLGMFTDKVQVSASLSHNIHWDNETIRRVAQEILIEM